LKKALASIAVVILACSITNVFGANLVGKLNDPNAIEGCGWDATSNSLGNAVIFLAEYDESVIIMNINRKDVHLKLDPRQTTGNINKVGDRLTSVYTAPGIIVKAVYTVTSTCPENDDSCEVTEFDVVYTARAGNVSEVVKGHGEVGC
jgi:hypothetical protein